MLDNTNKAIWPHYYVEAPLVPKWWKRELNRIGGYNHLAHPNLRIVWGMDERHFENDNPRAIKYENPNDMDLGWACWILERYAAPGTFFNEGLHNALRYGVDEVTGKTVDYLGPFKREGDYIKVLEMFDDDLAPFPNDTVFSQRMLDEIAKRVMMGAQKNVTLGILETQRRRRAAKKAAKLKAMQDERREYHRKNKDRINALHSRDYVGLVGSLAPLSSSVQTFQFDGHTMIPKGADDLCLPQSSK